MISFDYIRDYLKGRDLILYGMGKVCEECKVSLGYSGIPVTAYTKSGAINGGDIISPDSLSPSKHYVLISVGLQYEVEIVPSLREKGFLLTEDYTSWSFAQNFPFDYTYFGVPIGKRSRGVNAFDTAIKGGNSQVVSIGRYCSINERAYMGGDHAQMVTTNASLFDEILCDQYRNSNEIKNRKVTIGNDVWIGAYAFINSSKVKYIGDGAIIGGGVL